MARLPKAGREQVRPEDLPDFDDAFKVWGGRPFGYSNLLHSPRLAALINSLNQFFPLMSLIGEAPASEKEAWEHQKRTGRLKRSKLMEVAILTTLGEIDCLYAFSGHIRSAREAGLSEDALRAILQEREPHDLREEEDLVVRFTRELLRKRKISDTTFRAVMDRFGVQWTVELTGLVCYYLMFGYLTLALEDDGVSRELPG